jgi:hypothetical protein
MKVAVTGGPPIALADADSDASIELPLVTDGVG